MWLIALRNLLPCSRGMLLKTVGETIDAKNTNAPNKKEINMTNKFIPKAMVYLYSHQM